MTTFANLSLKNAALSAQTFSKVRCGDGNTADTAMAWWERRTSGIKVGFEKVSLMLRQPSKNLRSTKVTAKLVVPVLANITNSTVSGVEPAPTVAYSNMINIEAVLAERSTAVSRADLYQYTVDFVASDEFKNAILNTDPVTS